MATAQPLKHKKTLRAIGGREALPSHDQELKWLFWIGAGHLVLGIILYRVGGLVGLVHPLIVFALGIYWAINKRNSLDRIAMVLGYLIGSEVLWRMAQVPVFWEFGKYGTTAIIITALVVRGKFNVPKPVLIYFFALIPACVLTVFYFGVSDAIGHLSFNMSGPLALAAACWFFSHVQITPIQLRKLFFSIIVPLLSVAGVTLFFTAAAENIQFSTESNFATSGGFGPNQVSSMLGLGVFSAASCIVLFKNNVKLNTALGACAVLFTAQSMLTFSRGGIYNAVGGFLVLILFSFRNVTEGLKRLVPIAAFAAIFLWFVFPALDNFTGGKLLERFEETGTTNRTEIIESDWALFAESPIVGVGVGVAKKERGRVADVSGASHTEFSRMVSEHGIFGLIAFFSLIVIIVTNFLRQRSLLARALIAGSCVWAILFMFNAGMRLAAPSFVIGLSYVTIVSARRRKLPLRPAHIPERNIVRSAVRPAAISG